MTALPNPPALSCDLEPLAAADRLFGTAREVAVDRAIADLRAGRPVLIASHLPGGQPLLVFAGENINDATIGSLEALEIEEMTLVLSAVRVEKLVGQDVPSLPARRGEAMAVTMDSRDLGDVRRLISTPDAATPTRSRLATPAETSALELMQLALLLPAAAVVELPLKLADRVGDLATVSVADIHAADGLQDETLHIVARAAVPLAAAEDTEFVVFRGGQGLREQIAVIIGAPAANEPVLVRLHSACLTGDLFGSLKCDCGDQLRSGVRQMAEAGGGIMLYLDQEGRGNGIANKMRAYHLQSQGLDTFEADATLGFGMDQRRFAFAADMLRQLGYGRVRLMTNNPKKVAALQAAGLDVVERAALRGDVNPHNHGYLEAKRDQAGHADVLDVPAAE